MIENFLECSEYARNIFKEDEKILNVKKYAICTNVPIITDEVLAYMLFVATSIGAKNCLEIGTAIGYSAYYLSKNMDVTTIEIDEKRYNYARELLKEKKVNILLGDALEVIPTLTNTYDFIFIDAAKGQYKKFFDLCYDKLNDNGIIFIDNILFRGYVCSDKYPKRYKTIVKKLKDFIEYLRNYNFVLLPFGDGIGVVMKGGKK